ncbi:MAG: alpha/beta hydrolase, partial [Pyrinomonadaceae bacterium]
RSIGVCFESCKVIVDAAKWLTDAINDIHLAVAAVSGGPPGQSAPGPSTIAANFSTVQFDSCPIPSEGCPEQCDNADDFSQGSRKGVLSSQYFEPKIPAEMLDTKAPPGTVFNVPAARNIGSNEGRLNDDLRAAASDPRPLHSLSLAAYAFATNDTKMVNTATALADLSVTGRRAFGNFKEGSGPKEQFCQGLLSGRPPTLSEAAVLDGCAKALDRAYRVANFLRTGQIAETAAEKSKKTAEREALGWIAVSGEDDQPHRPVNVLSSDYPQYDFDVFVEAPLSQKAKTVKVRARYTIAQSQISNPGSSGKNLVIISLDLPSSGYTDNIDYEDVSPLAEIGTVKLVPVPDFQATGRTPMLDFIENFIVRFAETLETKVPVKSNFKAVMGGSLGGNMTFRLGRRPDTPWLPKFIVWSPASIWYSMGEGPDPLKHFGPRSAYEGAEAALKNPRPGDRAAFFGGWDKAILPLVIPMAQSDTWTSEYYPCKKSAIAAARLDRHETYNAKFLAWHWRLGGEQLLYSHQTIDTDTAKPRYMSNRKPMLLACGLEDTVAFNDICPATQNTAPKMIATPGKALFLAKTGHSLDNERRNYFAGQIIDFLGL